MITKMKRLLKPLHKLFARFTLIYDQKFHISHWDLIAKRNDVSNSTGFHKNHLQDLKWMAYCASVNPVLGLFCSFYANDYILALLQVRLKMSPIIITACFLAFSCSKSGRTSFLITPKLSVSLKAVIFYFNLYATSQPKKKNLKKNAWKNAKKRKKVKKKRRRRSSQQTSIGYKLYM